MEGASVHKPVRQEPEKRVGQSKQSSERCWPIIKKLVFLSCLSNRRENLWHVQISICSLQKFSVQYSEH